MSLKCTGMICEVCGFRFDHCFADDYMKEHAKYHDLILRGVRFRPMAGETVVYSADDYEVVEVGSFSDSCHRKRAYRVAVRGKKDTGYDFASYYHEGDPASMFIVPLCPLTGTRGQASSAPGGGQATSAARRQQLSQRHFPVCLSSNPYFFQTSRMVFVYNCFDHLK